MKFELLRGRARLSIGKSQCVSFALAAILLLFSTEHAASQQAAGTEALVKAALQEKSQVAAATSVIAPIDEIAITEIESESSDEVTARPVKSLSNVITGMAGTYIDPQAGETAESLVARALASNGDLIASRRNIERARARLQQARLRLNPSVSFEQATGRLTGSAGDSMTQVEFLYPLELGGKRTRRIQLAEGDIAAAEAEVANRERLVANDVMIAYADALAALRELEIMENSATIDVAGTADGVSLSIETPTDERIKQLEVVYNRHIRHVYTLCLRLLKEACAAEDATVAVFVRFNREMKRHLDEIQIEKRLRQLSINEALSRRKARDESNK